MVILPTTAKDSQYPVGREADLLQNIRSQLQNPDRGEKLECLVRYLMEHLKNLSDVELTPPSGYKRVDLTGRIDLLSETQLGSVDTKIKSKTQVKNTGSSISGKELSRLASRVDDGEIGLFFTASDYTRSTQEENLSTYSIRLFSGGDLTKLLAQTELTEDDKLTDRVVEQIHDEIE